MPTLLELQAAMRRGVLTGDDTDIAPHVVGPAAKSDLSVYRNNFLTNAAFALRLSFPAIRLLVGEEFFEGAARTFASGCPPHTSCLNDYGAEFATFLEHFPPATGIAYLADVARLEWAVDAVLHADDTAPLDVSSLANLSADRAGGVAFAPHPGVRLVRAGYPSDVIRRAVLARDDKALGQIDLSEGPVLLLVERTSDAVAIQRMDEKVWAFTKDLFAGRPLADALARATAIDATAILAEHLSLGRFAALRIDDSVDASGRKEVA